MTLVTEVRPNPTLLALSTKRLNRAMFQTAPPASFWGCDHSGLPAKVP